MKKLILSLFILSQVLLFYFGLSSSQPSLVLASFYSGYPAHFLAFFGTTFLFYLVLKNYSFRYPLIATISYSFFIGMLIEMLQSLTGRQLSFMDFIVDILGSFFAVAFIYQFPAVVKQLISKRTMKKKAEESLYNAMIISLIVGIIIVVVSLFIMRPAPEYFTELYYPKPDSLEKFIEPGIDRTFDITIYNHENGSKEYQIYSFAFITPGNRTITYFNESRSVKKERQLNLTISYNLQNFNKARVETRIVGKDQEIHFFVFNKEGFVQYPDYLASTACLNKTFLEGNITVTARGNYSPELKVYNDGNYRYSIYLTETPVNYTLPEMRGFIDLVFDSDYYNKTAGIDRNVFITKVMIGNTSFQGILDMGKGALAYDCENLRIAPLSSNGAYRMWLS